ncbi:hypothetical protein FRC02_011240 [Tulasnella sp. 418]|nr:hypothetical protein FRC02_011240 [Tulasnella sp. 418]
MVFLGDKKFACATCIKGHRSSTCTHTTRPLFEIRAKGRPVSQCEHCRELRKTKQVHVKCECDSRPSIQRSAPPPSSVSPDGVSTASSSSDATAVITTRKGARKVKTLEAATATFPHGIQDVIDAAALLSNISSPTPHHPPQPDPSLIDSKPVIIPPCQCSTSKDGACNCCTPRYVPKSKRTPSLTSDLPLPGYSEPNTRPPPPALSLSIPTTLHYGAPGTSTSTSPSASVTTPSSSAHQHHAIDGHHCGGVQNDHHSRHTALYSPYSAHGHAHGHGHGHGHGGLRTSQPGALSSPNPSPVHLHAHSQQHLQIPGNYHSNNASTSSLASPSHTNPPSPYPSIHGPPSPMQLEPRNEWDGLLIPVPTLPSPSPTNHHGMPLTPHSTPLMPGTPVPPQMVAANGSPGMMQVDMLEGIFAKYAAAGPSSAEERFSAISGIYPEDHVGDGQSGLLAAAALLGLGRVPTVNQPGLGIEDTSTSPGPPNTGGLFDGVVGDPNPAGLFDPPPPAPQPQESSILPRGRSQGRRVVVPANGVEQMYHSALGGSTSPVKGSPPSCDGGLTCHCWNMNNKGGESSGPVCTDDGCGCCTSRRNQVSIMNPEFVGGVPAGVGTIGVGSGFAVSSDRDSVGVGTSSSSPSTAFGTANSGGGGGPNSEFGATFGQIVNHQLTAHNPLSTAGPFGFPSTVSGGGFETPSRSGSGRRDRSLSNASSSEGSTHSSSVATSRASVVLAASGSGGGGGVLLSPTATTSSHQHPHSPTSLSRSNSAKSVGGRKPPRTILPKPNQAGISNNPNAMFSMSSPVSADGHLGQAMMFNHHYSQPQQQPQLLPPSIVVVHPDDGNGRFGDASANMVVGGGDYYGMRPSTDNSSLDGLFQPQQPLQYTPPPPRSPSSHSRSRSVGGGGILLDRSQFDANQSRHQRSSSFGGGGIGLRPDPAPSIELIVSPPSPSFTG